MKTDKINIPQNGAYPDTNPGTPSPKHDEPQTQPGKEDAPVKPDKNIPLKPDKNPDPTMPKPGGNEPHKADPTRIEEPHKHDPTRIDPVPETPAPTTPAPKP